PLWGRRHRQEGASRRAGTSLPQAACCAPCRWGRVRLSGCRHRREGGPRLALASVPRESPLTEREGKSMSSKQWIAAVIAGLVFTLGGAASWGQVPSTNDKSGSGANTGGGMNALGKVTPNSPTIDDGVENTAYGSQALSSNTSGSN